MKHDALVGLIVCSCLVPGPAPAADTLSGRLFFTPTERRALEAIHKQPALREDMTPPAAPFRFDGMLWQRDRLVAMWIDNGIVAAEADRRPVLERGQLLVSTPTGGPEWLHPGDRWPARAGDRSPIRLQRVRHPGQQFE